MKKKNTILMVLMLGIILLIVFNVAYVNPTDEDNNTDQPANNKSEDTVDLREVWENNDDYPNRENVNYQVFDSPDRSKWYLRVGDISMFGNGSLNTSFGTATHTLNGGKEAIPGQQRWVANIESEDKFDVYVLDGNASEILKTISESPSAVKHYERIDKYSVKDVREYNKVISVENDNSYTVVYTPSGADLPDNISQILDYDGKDIELEGYYLNAYYISYEKFKNNSSAQSLYSGQTYTK